MSNNLFCLSHRTCAVAQKAL